MLQNQLCENININNEDFSISDAIVIKMYPTLTAYFNSRFGGKFCKHQKSNTLNFSTQLHEVVHVEQSIASLNLKVYLKIHKH